MRRRSNFLGLLITPLLEHGVVCCLLQSLTSRWFATSQRRQVATKVNQRLVKSNSNNDISVSRAIDNRSHPGSYLLKPVGPFDMLSLHLLISRLIFVERSRSPSLVLALPLTAANTTARLCFHRLYASFASWWDSSQFYALGTISEQSGLKNDKDNGDWQNWHLQVTMANMRIRTIPEPMKLPCRQTMGMEVLEPRCNTALCILQGTIFWHEISTYRPDCNIAKQSLA
jgi:hypothetical protein